MLNAKCHVSETPEEPSIKEAFSFTCNEWGHEQHQQWQSPTIRNKNRMQCHDGMSHTNTKRCFWPVCHSIIWHTIWIQTKTKN
jgi:hypothetical protein